MTPVFHSNSSAAITGQSAKTMSIKPSPAESASTACGVFLLWLQQITKSRNARGRGPHDCRGVSLRYRSAYQTRSRPPNTRNLENNAGHRARRICLDRLRRPPCLRAVSMGIGVCSARNCGCSYKQWHRQQVFGQHMPWQPQKGWQRCAPLVECLLLIAKLRVLVQAEVMVAGRLHRLVHDSRAQGPQNLPRPPAAPSVSQGRVHGHRRLLGEKLRVLVQAVAPSASGSMANSNRLRTRALRLGSS